MTDNKTRQKGPPAADLIRQETGGGPDPELIQEPAPAADQEGQGPAKRKKKKIIIVKGADGDQAAADTLPDAETEAEGADWQDMTPHEFIEYAQDNPAAARQNIQEYFIAKFGREESEKLKEQAIKAAKAMSEAADSAVFNAMQAIAVKNQVAQQFERIQRQIFDVIAAVRLPEGANIDDLDLFLDEWDALEPFADAIIADYPAYNGMSTADLLDSLPFWWLFYMNDPDAIDDRARDAREAADIKAAIEIIKRARAARDQAAAAAEAAARAAERAKYTPAHVQGTDKIEYPVDKPNNNFWDNAWRTLTENPDGQLTFSFEMATDKDKRKGVELPLLLSINFDALQDVRITKKLTPFDKRVYIAVSALFNAGNPVIALSQIYKHMGYKGRAGAADLKKIHECIVKMMGAQISVDNELEAGRYKRYGHFKYRGVLLPVELGELYDMQGALTDAAIHILKEPPLMTFARQRDQLTTVSLKLLQSPISKTDSNLAIDDYLIVQIKRAQKKETHGQKRMLFKTIYKNTGIPEKPTTNTERQQKKRAPGKIEKYLTHYKTEGTITNYTMEKDGITVFW